MLSHMAPLGGTGPAGSAGDPTVVESPGAIRKGGRASGAHPRADVPETYRTAAGPLEALHADEVARTRKYMVTVMLLVVLALPAIPFLGGDLGFEILFI